MNKLILCEGKTDAILLSYYLSCICNWEHYKAPKGLNIKAEAEHGESICWYRRDSDFLLICAVGSKNSFRHFFANKIAGPLFDSSAFFQIALLLDRDEETVSDIVAMIRSDLPSVAENALNECWVRHAYHNSFGEVKELDFLLLIIPPEQQGTLETLLLKAISEDAYDKNIVDKSQAYVDEIASEAARYLGKRRLILKAYLGVTWAIQSPQKVFDFIDEQIRTVKWEDSEVLSQCFCRIREI